MKTPVSELRMFFGGLYLFVIDYVTYMKTFLAA